MLRDFNDTYQDFRDARGNISQSDTFETLGKIFCGRAIALSSMSDMNPDDEEKEDEKKEDKEKDKSDDSEVEEFDNTTSE